MEFTFTQLLGILGIPSIISGIFMLSIQSAANGREKKRDEEQATRCEHEVSMLECVSASLSLGLVTAKAIKKIPDVNENEDIDKAVTEAESVRKKHDAFLQKQVSKSIRR